MKNKYGIWMAYDTGNRNFPVSGISQLSRNTGLGDCRVINSNTGQEYDFEDSFDFMDDSITAIMPGGSSEGWFGYIIDKNSPSPMMLYLSLNDKILYFKLDQAYELPDDQEPYVSVIPKQNPIRNTSSAKGDWKNPYGLEDTIKLDYNPSSAYRQNAPFAGNIQVLEAYRGEAAAYFLEDDYYSDHHRNAYMDPAVQKIKVKVDSMETNAAPSFDGRNFTVLSGRGGVIGNPVLPQPVFKKDGIDRVYQGGTVEGYVGFLVPKDLEFMEITYGYIYDRIDTAWIDLEFSEEHPEEIITGQERMDNSKGVWGGQWEYTTDPDYYTVETSSGIYEKYLLMSYNMGTEYVECQFFAPGKGIICQWSNDSSWIGSVVETSTTGVSGGESSNLNA